MKNSSVVLLLPLCYIFSIMAMEVEAPRYIPLIIKSTKPFVEFTDRQDPKIEKCHAAHSGALYIIHYQNEQQGQPLEVQELQLRRYAGSAVLKTPWFSPGLGFNCITNNYTHPLIKNYTAFIKNKYCSSSFPNLLFYAEAKELEELQKPSALATYVTYLGNMFTKQAPQLEQKIEHPLLTKLKQVQKVKDGSEQICANVEEPFEQTIIFIDSKVKLQDLQQINRNIDFNMSGFCLQDEEEKLAEYTSFQRWKMNT